MTYKPDWQARMSTMIAYTNDNIDDSGNGGVAVLDHVDLVTQVQFITQAPYHNGQSITIQASVTNNGPDSAKNVDIFEFGTLLCYFLGICIRMKMV